MTAGATPNDASISQCDALNYVTSPSIRVSVGNKELGAQEFFVHQALINARSEFFAKATRGPWKESQSRIVALPDDEPRTFRVYLKLLYTDRLPAAETVVAAADPPDVYLLLSKMYVLAEKLIDNTCKATVLSALLAIGQETDDKGVHARPGRQTVLSIYNGTPEGSPARQWLINLYTEHIGREGEFDIFPHVRDLPQDFLSDLVSSMITWRPLPCVREQLSQKEKELRTMDEQLRKKQNELYESRKAFDTKSRQLRSAERARAQLETELNMAKRERDRLRGSTASRAGSPLL